MKKKLITLGLLLSMASGTLNSCLEESESITEATRYTSNDVKSYADLFKVFWKVMDQRYNYFYEQKRNDDMDWNTIYKTYYPKFEALKSYNQNSGASDADYQADAEKARQYFTEIVDPIIDRHFNVKIKMPYSNSGINITYTFYGGMKTKGPNTYPFDNKYAYMKERLEDGALLSNNFLLAGSLKANPGVYYFSFKNFTLSSSQKINLSDKYLSPDPGNNLVLTPAMIENSSELNAITNITVRNQVKNFTLNILNQWNTFPNSNDIKAFNEQIKTFKTTEILSDPFLTLTQQALTQSNNLVKYSAAATYSSVSTNETLPYIQWFIQKMDEHVKYGYNLNQFQTAATAILAKAPFYKKFLNPLRRGNIKKIIIDLRSNGGGAVIDARFFSDRFITKNAIAYYQRTKEGNGQFNYTPWVPVQTTPHLFGIPKNIPTVILTDKASASMSEITTLMLKSQGNHIISMGDYSAGATAGLGGSDDFNGGSRDLVAGGILEFYIPLMAAKDASGAVIEGIGVKPDIYVTPPTDAELQQMKNSPATFIDRVIEEALKYLSTQ
ncbi:S41 family peptidase [Chryseobacterium sp. OSA05B]|uniref:S41 family peptidase n=1 Tax=Chryseobacterium sp. OSA05B TaxID=2862650 RepID=UPI001CC00583|nr:S41 family peptidase [Chryseobacterium sp. OSA05B]